MRSPKKLFFATLSLLSVLGYGFFVFAAPPGPGGYNPGETLDPECTPGQLVPEPCIVISPLMTADNGLTVIGSNVQLGGELIQNTQIEQNGNNFSFTGGNVGINNAYADFTLDVGGTSTYSLNGSIFFSGTLDDLSVDISGYLGATAIVYSVFISDIAGPDQIDWSDSRGNSGSFLIDGSAQELSYGVTVTFSNTTGHAGDESWSFTIDKTEQGILNVSEQINLGGIYFARQNQNGSVFLGNRVEYFDDLENSFFVGGQAGIGAVNASNSNFIGENAGKNAVGAFNSNFFGSDAGQGSAGAFSSNFIGTQAGGGKFGNDSSYANFIGTQAGYGARNAFNSNFLGYGTGNDAIDAYNANFIGTNAGRAAANADSSNFIGFEAGDGATFSSSSNFIGVGAGNGAEFASLSNFLGYQAGLNADNASNSIFIGYNSGANDGVDNVSVSGWSILIGDNTNTGGFSNSIALGKSAVNSASDQFYLTDTITQMSLRGVNYTLPATDGNSGDVLTTDSLGGLTWLPAGGVSLQWYAENAVAPGTAPVATGAGSIALGDRAEALAADMFVYGSIAGEGATSASNSNFFGASAGRDAVNASNSNFFGASAGRSTNAQYSNFFGNNAGLNAANASTSNFFGVDAGNGAINAVNSNFFGKGAGQSATTAQYSNFFGEYAGSGATTAQYSNFFGQTAGENSVNAANSIFIGTKAGQNDTVNNTTAYNDISTFANTSILIGHKTSTGGFSNSIALGAYAANTAANQLLVGSSTRPIGSIFIGGDHGTASVTSTFFVGYRAGQNATSASNSNFLGNLAGGSATSASNSNFFGVTAGNASTGANNSNFFGSSAGRSAPNAFHSNFFGQSAGQSATSSSYSNFFGYQAGNGTAAANHANFFGREAGSNADNANNSNFIGNQTGYEATNASYSNFIGTDAGNGSASAANSIFIGRSAGDSDPVDNTTDPDDYSIAIGNYATPDGYSNSIALGQRATNTDSNEFMIGSSTRRIETMVFNGGVGNTCAINAATGITCSSDERLKTNITDLSLDSLEKVSTLRTVTYNWKTDPNGKSMIGFIAQDLQAQFPELVSQNIDGMLSVNYAGMAPVLVEAIREMNLNVTQIADMTRENTWRDSLIAWFGNAANGIENFIAGTIKARTQVCIDDVCVNKEQLQAILQNNGIVSQSSPIIGTPPPTDDPVIDNTTDDTVTDPDTDTNTPSEESPVSTEDTNSTENTEPSTTE